MQYLHAKDLSLEDFLTFLRNCSFPDDALLMAFSPDKAYFNLFQFDETFFMKIDQGRIFSPEGELKWRRLGDLMRVVYLGGVVLPFGLEDYSAEMEGLIPEQKEFILWGERTEKEDEWIEQQVPHRFHYPVSGKNYSRGRVALVMEFWMDSAGMAKFGRYHSLKEIPGGE